jgi:predicted esterase
MHHPALLLLAWLPLAAMGYDDVKGPQDFALEFTSPFDGSQQPYRIYLPTAYDGKTALPMLVALHGTGGDQNKYFDHEAYHHGIYKTEAEKRGLIVLCPLGTDANGLPTEWRGEAEINLLGLLQEAERRFLIDPERVVCTGQSMGGTATTYLCCRYPDVFAAGIPLASTYGHLSLVTNLRHVPMLYVQGGKDWPVYAATGPVPITRELRRLGYRGELWMIDDAGHNTFDASTPRVLDWALEQRREAHPRHITHRAYFPPHGRAWWVEISEIARPGWFAEVDARAEGGNLILVRAKNTPRVVLRPDPALYDPAQPLVVWMEEREVFRGLCDADQELLLALKQGLWTASTRPRQPTARIDWGDFVIGTVGDPPTWEGGPETTLGNWLTDAMRDISGTDIAICTKGHYRVGAKMRGAPVRAGQELRFMEMINWLRPSDAALATFEIKGADLLAILEMNLLDAANSERFVVQVSGCRYRFDRSLPSGARVVESDIQPDREYRVVANSSAITRTDTLHLGDLYGKLNHEVLEPNMLSAAWSFALKNDGRISARLEGRVVEKAP